MGYKTTIGWCQHTFNPWWGCVEVSPGCAHCYAREFAADYGHEVWGKNKPRRFFGEKHWNEPLKWNRMAAEAGERRRVFCASMADWAEKNPILDPWREKLWPLIKATPSLDWLLLTKRVELIEEFLPLDWGLGYPNAWLMTTIENADYAWRADILRKIPATVRGISYEPALGPLAGALNLEGLDWIIYGGESGNGSNDFRQDDPQWALDMEAACRVAGVAFYGKQRAGIRSGVPITIRGREIHETPTARYALPELN